MGRTDRRSSGVQPSRPRVEIQISGVEQVSRPCRLAAWSNQALGKNPEKLSERKKVVPQNQHLTARCPGAGTVSFWTVPNVEQPLRRDFQISEHRLEQQRTGLEGADPFSYVYSVKLVAKAQTGEFVLRLKVSHDHLTRDAHPQEAEEFPSSIPRSDPRDCRCKPASFQSEPTCNVTFGRLLESTGGAGSLHACAEPTKLGEFTHATCRVSAERRTACIRQDAAP